MSIGRAGGKGEKFKAGLRTSPNGRVGGKKDVG
jgi:hypothetical protein